MAGYISLIVEEGMNFFVSGETASGKTTLMNALMTFIAPDGEDRQHRGHAGSAGAAPELDARSGARRR